MNDSCCKTCGKKGPSVKNCLRCKKVAYCSEKCQREDWNDGHKEVCKRADFASAPCDVCKSTENEIQDICFKCGLIICVVCHDNKVIRKNGEIVSHGRCPGCDERMRMSRTPADCKKMEKFIKSNQLDPRKAHWHCQLGRVYLRNGSTQTARKHFELSGELGLGEGFSRIAELYINKREWDEARRWYRKAAEQKHIIAITTLAVDARRGYFLFSWIVQEDNRNAPDLEESFRLFREGASLGDPHSAACLGQCYMSGQGTKKNVVKGIKYIKRGAEKGSVDGMRLYGQYYLRGEGVEQSNEQAKYWLEKSLEVEDYPGIRDIIRDNNL